jgi:hypothetical protein
MMTRHILAGVWIPDPSCRRLRVWTVRATVAAPDDRPDGYIPHPVRVPAYTPGEAVQAGAALSGLPPEDWGGYLWTVTTTHEELPGEADQNGGNLP